MTGGWAGLPRYIAGQRFRARIAARTARIDALVAEQAVAHPPVVLLDVDDLLALLREEQDADLTLLDDLNRAADGPLVRPGGAW